MPRQDTGLIVALVAQSAIGAAASSAGLTQLASPGVIASVGLLSAMLSSGLAAYVAATSQRRAPPERPMAVQVGAEYVDDHSRPAPTGR